MNRLSDLQKNLLSTILTSIDVFCVLLIGNPFAVESTQHVTLYVTLFRDPTRWTVLRLAKPSLPFTVLPPIFDRNA